ncbi:unnamed protein product [Sphagnum jensenii]|uniref:Ankyrin n=1 Tax=Sphagnum jensenii TaxID=128206 RepID=A0ABP0X8X7_9BRYO
MEPESSYSTTDPPFHFFLDLFCPKALLDHPSIDVNSRDELERTPLHAVSWRNKRFECVRLLLDRSDIDVNPASRFAFTPLHAAARFACPQVLELLLADSRVRIDAKTVDGFTALHLVAEGGENHHREAASVRPWQDRCQVVRMLLEAERQQRARNLPCNLNKEDVLKRFPIHYGVECDSVNMVKELLEWKDANINQLDLYGFAPLHLAVRSRANLRPVVVESLLQVQNIDVNIASVRSSSDVQRLKMAGKNEAGMQLFFPFRPLEAPQESSTNLTPLHFAAKMGSTRIVDLLLGSPKIELNMRDSRDYAPLHFAAQDGHVEVVQTFLQEGPGRVNFEAQDDEGLTPVWRATLNDRLEVATLLWDVTSRQEYDRIDILLQRLLTVDRNLKTVRFLVNSFPEDKLIQVIEEMGNADDLKFETTRANLLGRLQDEFAFPNGTRSQDETLLHWVAKTNRWKLIPQILISNRHMGGFVNQMDFAQKKTALHCAAKDGHDDVVKTLLAHVKQRTTLI